MYHHVKQLMYTVRSGNPTRNLDGCSLSSSAGRMVSWQPPCNTRFRGSIVRSARKDLLMDIGTEELSHLEIIGSLARLHLRLHQKVAMQPRSTHSSPSPGAAAWVCSTLRATPGRPIT